MEPNGTTAIERVTPEYRGLTMAVSPAEAMKRLQQLQAFVKEVMVEATDYGVIPGTDKPTLLKPGAEKLCEIYGFAPQFETVNKIEDWDKGLFHYEMRCRLLSRRDGSFVADGCGSCNSKEKKYAGRWAFDNEIPPGVDKKSLRRREGKSKKPPYKPYTQFFIANDDIFSLVNTIQKMACKRAMVAAVIGATRSAGIFTQDLEDLPAEAFGKPERAPVAEVIDPEAIEAKRKALFETILTAITSSHSLDQLNEASKQLVRAKNDGALLGPQISLLADEGKARKAKLEQDVQADPDAEERAAMQEDGGADAS